MQVKLYNMVIWRRNDIAYKLIPANILTNLNWCRQSIKIQGEIHLDELNYVT